MKKLIEKDPSYYRISLGGNSLIYLSHTKDMRGDYVDLDIKDIIAKVDDLVEGFNAVSEAIQNINALVEFKKLKEEIDLLNEKLTKVGDNVATIMENLK